MQIDNQYLLNVMEAFKKRSKAIKHKGCKLEFSREVDQGFERINIDREYLDCPPVQIRLSIWNDGEIYYRTCQSHKTGWKHRIEISGNVSEIEPADIEILFEQGLNLKIEHEVLELWKVANPKLK